MTVEKGIKKIIENKFGNVKYFSEEIDLPYTTVRSILERGVLNAKVENVIKIAEGLDMDPKEFLKLDRENIMVVDDNQTIIDNLLDIMKDLNINRKEKVYNFANKQLKEQQNNIVVLKQFKDVLTSNGVTEIETIGKTFDPELHEAITSVVDENGKFIGLVTDGDIRRMLARGAEFLDEPVEDLMTKNPVIITKDKMAAEALSMMEKHQPKPITVLPVIDVEKNEPVGIVHLTDLLRQGVV